MSNVPQYFLPGVDPGMALAGGRVNRELLAAHGLQELWNDVEAMQISQPHVKVFAEVQPPLFGLCVSARTEGSDAPSSSGYRPGEQKWRKLSDQLWLGLAMNLERPGPRELARNDSCGGHWLKLGDGQHWLVPVVRPIEGIGTLPGYLARGDDGNVSWRIVRKHQRLWERAGRLWNELGLSWARRQAREQGSELDEVWRAIEAGERLKIGDELDFAVDVLAVNYRIDHALQAELELITSGNLWPLIRAALDLPAVEAWADASEKKSAPETPPLAATPPG